MIEEKVVMQLRELLDLWHVTYNVEEEKYVAKTNSFVVLTAEQIEWIGQLGLTIFSIQKYVNTLVVKFVSVGGRSF